MRYHLTLRYEVAANTIGAASLAETTVKLEKILRSIFVGFAWCMVVIFLLNCVLILLLDLKTHKIGSLRTCILLVMLRIVLNELHMLCTFLYILVVNDFLIIYFGLSMILLR